LSNAFGEGGPKGEGADGEKEHSVNASPGGEFWGPFWDSGTSNLTLSTTAREMKTTSRVEKEKEKGVEKVIKRLKELLRNHYLPGGPRGGPTYFWEGGKRPTHWGGPKGFRLSRP